MAVPMRVAAAFAAVWISIASAQKFVGSNSSESAFAVSLDPPGSLSSTCNNTFTTDITCDISLPGIAFNGYFPTSDDLTALCTTDCLQSLDSFRSLQSKSCAADVFDSAGQSYPVLSTADTLIWTYNYTCRRDASTGAFCAPLFDSWANGNASQSSCSDCVLGTYQLQLSNIEGYDPDLVSSYSSLTSSCQATGYPLTSPAANTVSRTSATGTASPTPTAAKACSFNYTIKAGDDCHSISNAQKVSTNNLLYLNNLEAGCTDFPASGTSLCMPHTCDVYTVKANDTCYGISQAFDNAFTNSQLISWNIDINRGCDNLELLVDNQICVSYPGDASAPTATAPASTMTQAPVPTNVVDGTNTKCGKYYEVRGGDTCAGITNNLGIALSDFYFLNPEINSTSCNNLFLGYSYCVQAVGSINTYPGYGGSPTNPCVGGSSVRESSCYATTYSTVSAYTFPIINATASSNASSTSYSSVAVTPMSALPVQSGKPVSTPAPVQDGMVAGCTKFYNVQSGDGCYDIAARWGIALNDMYSWNPALKGDCTGLIAGQYICTGRGTTTSSSSRSSAQVSTTTTKPTTSSAGTAPPGPTQAGISADCNKWVMQNDGVYCYDMAANAGISLNCLYQMNPALNQPSECAGLWAGEAYCIGTASKVCT